MTALKVSFTPDQVRKIKAEAIKKKLKGADILNEFTDDQIIESFNGAGSSSAPEWERWFLTKILRKKLPAILVHDMTFRKGGTDDDFHRANDELMENIISTDGDERSIWWNLIGRMARWYSELRGRPSWGKV